MKEATKTSGFFFIVQSELIIAFSFRQPFKKNFFLEEFTTKIFERNRNSLKFILKFNFLILKAFIGCFLYWILLYFFI